MSQFSTASCNEIAVVATFFTPALDEAVLRNHEEDWRDEELSHPQKSSQKIKVSLVKVTLSHFSHAQLIQISTKQGDIPAAKKLQCTVLSTQEFKEGDIQKDKGRIFGRF